MNTTTRSHSQRPTSIESLVPLTGVLKRTVTARLARQFSEHVPLPLLRRAVEDAESIASSTGFADLFFPELAAEKARLVKSALYSDPFTRPHVLRTAA